MKNKLEELAELEHEQWISWTKSVVKQWKDSDGDFDFLIFKWEKNWKPYKDLTETEKEKDRKWARKVLSISKS